MSRIELKETIEEFGGRGIALSDRGGFFTDLTRTFVGALGSPNYFNHDAGCGGNVHNAARSLFGFGHEGLIADLGRARHLVLYGRNITESIHGQGGQGLHGRRGARDARHLHRSARQHHRDQGHPVLAGTPRTATTRSTSPSSTRSWISARTTGSSSAGS